MHFTSASQIADISSMIIIQTLIDLSGEFDLTWIQERDSTTLIDSDECYNNTVDDYV